MANVKIPIRDSRGLIVKVVEVDESEPLLGRVNALETECDDLRTRLSEAEVTRATESNRLNEAHQAELSKAQALDRRATDTMLDFDAALFRFNKTIQQGDRTYIEDLKKEIHRLREALRAETGRATTYEAALARRDEADRAAWDRARAARRRQRQKPPMDPDEAALNRFAEALYR